MDHISALTMALMLMIFTVNSRSKEVVLATHRRAIRLLSIGKNVFEERESDGITLGGEDNSVYDLWSSSIVIFTMVVIVGATIAHPVSMQAFIIAIAFGLGIIYYKIVILDRGIVEPLEERVSAPDLIIGIVLLVISLVFFVLDSFVFYWGLHPLWHALSGIAVPFYASGVSKGSPHHYSIVEYLINS